MRKRPKLISLSLGLFRAMHRCLFVFEDSQLSRLGFLAQLIEIPELAILCRSEMKNDLELGGQKA
jgi:hypothetical protein